MKVSVRPAPTSPNTPVTCPANTDNELFFTIGAIFQALENRMPMAVWQAGVDGEIGKAPVDMTLLLRRSLDNAGALPTYRQAQPQQQPRVA
jgi:hypothetical protein